MAGTGGTTGALGVGVGSGGVPTTAGPHAAEQQTSARIDPDRHARFVAPSRGVHKCSRELVVATRQTAGPFSRSFVRVRSDDSTEGDSIAETAAPHDGGWVLTLVHHPDPRAVGRRVHLGIRVDPSSSGGPCCGPNLPEDRRLSRAHARITVDARGVEVEDLESRNGTTVDGERIRRASLRPDALLGLGSLLVHVGRGKLRARAGSDTLASCTRAMPWPRS